MKKLMTGLLSPILDKTVKYTRSHFDKLIAHVESSISHIKARYQNIMKIFKPYHAKWKNWDSGWHFTPALWLLPELLRKQVKLEKRIHRRKMANTLVYYQLCEAVQAIVDRHEMARKPDGDYGLNVHLQHDGAPSFHMYCCVSSFSDAEPVMREIMKLGYRMEPDSTTEQQYNMSKTYHFRKKKTSYSWDYIFLTSYALKELGSTCKAISMGYERASTPRMEEQFKLVCDEFEAAVIEQDYSDPNFL